MNQSYWGYWLILLGVFVIVIMLLVSNVTNTNTQDYYLIKEVTEASLVDSVDLAYYRQSRELRINKEMFVENFLRRFAENVALSDYQVDFYGLYEAPPKVSVKVTTKSATYNIAASDSSFDITNRIDAILELDGAALTAEKQDNTISSAAVGSGSRSSGRASSGNGSTSGNGTSAGTVSARGSSSGSSSSSSSRGSGSSSSSDWFYDDYDYDNSDWYSDDDWFNGNGYGDVDDSSSDGSEAIPTVSKLKSIIGKSNPSLNTLVDLGFCFTSGSTTYINTLEEIEDASVELFENNFGRKLTNLEASAARQAGVELYQSGFLSKCKDE